MMQNRSRIRSRVKSSLYKKTALTFFFIVLIVFVIGFFGINLLVKLSLFLGNLKSKGESIQTSSDSEFILPPTLNPLYDATFSATIEVLGTAVPGESVDIYLNGEVINTTLVDNTSQFKLGGLHLAPGTNRIKVKAKKEGKESKFSDEAVVILDTTPPALEVKEPTDGTVVKDNKQVKIAGKTETDAAVTINDFLPVVDQSGNFSYILPLQDGDNLIKIKARDKAGNETKQELKVSYQH